MKGLSKERFLVGCLLLPLLTLTGCFGRHATVTGTYMYKTDTVLRCLELTQVDKTVKGQAIALKAAVDQPGGIEISKVDISGEVDGDAIRLGLQSEVTWLQGTTLTGKWGNDQITLNIPDANGTIEQVRYKRVTVEEWNDQVRKFRDKCAQQAAEWQRERERQATIKQLREEQDTTYTDLVRAWRSLADNMTGLHFTLQALAIQNRNIKTMERRLERANAAADKAAREARNAFEMHQADQFRFMSQADQVRSAAIEINSELVSLKGQREQIQAAVDSYTNGISQSKQEIAEDNAKLSSIVEQLHTLSPDHNDSGTSIHFSLGQTIRNTPCYSAPDVNSSIVGTDPAGCYLAVVGKNQNWCFVISRNLSIIYLPAGDVKILDEQP